ncbi:MAG: glycosyltransferase [Richelia sp. CSU_2_1]|nr:glycosyltransferase [Microcoleus sp. SM1_3_4]NJR22996.1 glycosyltransferase [Richelia sp. CSU_2_1]
MSDRAPLVSAVIPAYNCAPYIGQAVDSVLNQTYANCEIVVVDDGSKDDTKLVLEKYGDRVRYIYQQNQGVSVARNRGIELARGEFVAFLDADDFFFFDKIAAQIAVFAAQPNLGIVHSGWRLVNSKGEPIRDVKPWENIPKLDLEMWLRWKPVLPSAMVFRRSWLQQAGGFDPRFPPAEDTDLALRLALMGCETAWLKQVTVGYRQHEQSAMHKGLPQANSLAAVIDNFFAQPELPDKIRLLEKQIKYSTLVWIAWYLHRTGHPVEMAQFLQRSWNFTPYLPVETVINWADCFAEFYQEFGKEFDADLLASSDEWQNLMQWIIAAQTSY